MGGSGPRDRWGDIYANEVKVVKEPLSVMAQLHLLVAKDEAPEVGRCRADDRADCRCDCSSDGGGCAANEGRPAPGGRRRAEGSSWRQARQLPSPAVMTDQVTTDQLTPAPCLLLPGLQPDRGRLCGGGPLPGHRHRPQGQPPDRHLQVRALGPASARGRWQAQGSSLPAPSAQ